MRLLALLLAIVGAGMLCIVALGVFVWTTPANADDAAADVAAGVATRLLVWSALGLSALVASVVVFLAARRSTRS